MGTNKMIVSPQWAYKGLEIPEDWESLKDFIIWYKNNNYPMLPPSDMSVYVTDITASTIIFRRGRFQVEMYLIYPGADVVAHAHDLDLSIIYLGGAMEARAMGMAKNFGNDDSRYPKDIPHQDSGMATGILPAGIEHSFTVSVRGCLFLNIQQWKMDELSSATVNYQGTALGPIHAEKLSNA
jgi:hypothetical protein